MEIGNQWTTKSPSVGYEVRKKQEVCRKRCDGIEWDQEISEVGRKQELALIQELNTTSSDQCRFDIVSDKLYREDSIS